MKVKENTAIKQRVLEKVLKTKKYHSIYQPTIKRIIDDLAAKYPDKQLEKKTKQKLHQIWGAYFHRPNFDKLFKNFKIKAKKEGTQKALENLLMLQTSTKERTPILDNYYKEIFKITGEPNKIIEAACGINALTYPWMKTDAKYIGFDVDIELIDFINNVFHEIDVYPKANVKLGDILIDKPEKADVVFLLKVLVLLDRQRKDGGIAAMRQYPCKYLIVSFPTLTLSGRDKGMLDYYTTYFCGLTKEEGWRIERIVFENEVVFVVKKE